MATIKSYTDISQSKKLTEILPLESADMCFKCFGKETYDLIFCEVSYSEWAKDYKELFDKAGLQLIPCWSLAALLNYLKSKDKFQEINELSDGRFKLTTYIWDGEHCIQVSIGDSIVDACYEMIIKLHELNLL